MPLFKFLSRRNRMQAYRQARREVEMISDADSPTWHQALSLKPR